MLYSVYLCLVKLIPPFPTDSAIWKQKTNHYQPGGYITSSCAFFLKGDTIINSTSYKKVYYSPDGNNVNQETFFAGIREINKKVYAIIDSATQHQVELNGLICYPEDESFNFSEEHLLYDFDSNIGDTIFNLNSDSIFTIINNIDSVLINGVYRKQFNYFIEYSTEYYPACYPQTNNYVEGIGDINNGLFSHWLHYFEAHHFLGCYQDDSTIYVNQNNTSSCESVGISNNINHSNILISPNPFSEQIEILYYNNVNFYSIYSITGKQLINCNKLSNSFIDLSFLKNGVYILQLTNPETGESFTKKILKQ